MNTGSLKKLSAFLIAGCLLSAFYTAAPAYGVSRIKDIADFEGVRDNQLVGYGLVVGLNGTGDNIKSVERGRRHGNRQSAGICPSGKPD